MRPARRLAREECGVRTALPPEGKTPMTAEKHGIPAGLDPEQKKPGARGRRVELRYAKNPGFDPALPHLRVRAGLLAGLGENGLERLGRFLREFGHELTDLRGVGNIALVRGLRELGLELDRLVERLHA